VIANTMVKHSVAGGEYTSRRAQVEEAAAVIGKHRPEVKFLRDATVEDLAKWSHEMSPEAVKRARHVITECTRTVAACEALMKHDLKTLGQLMAEAHTSYSKDFEGSCVEADTMVELAQELPGLIGARLTGGGFGGCTINLVEQAHATEFSKALGERYKAKTGIEPQIMVCHASDGAHRIG
jgi:galactokinase